MQNNFPRIYSLSTIGIKQHFNADYLFHPYRTDFSGESGSGKSMIADMIQLILIGSYEFKSATDGNKDRDVKGMLLSVKGKAAARGYIFLNIEIKPKQFIVLGAYIESTSNVAEMFIIQNGYDWKELTPLNHPIFTKDIIIDGKIDTLNNLCDRIEFARMKALKRKNYHQVLYDNNILSLDLTKEDTLKTYASILRSFSRGKGFKKESENLKRFLFGDDEKDEIKIRYDEEVKNITNDFYEHKRYVEEIKLIQEKYVLLKSVLEKSKLYKTAYSEYLIEGYSVWNKLKQQSFEHQQIIGDALKTKDNELNFIEKQINRLNISELEELLRLKETVARTALQAENYDNVENKFFDAKRDKEAIEKVEGWLKLNENKLEKVKDWFSSQYRENDRKKALQDFKDYLTKENVLNDFENSNWLANFESEEIEFSKRIEGLEKEIIELNSLSKFTDIDNPESLLNWAMENLQFPISHHKESTLIYFQKYGRVKPLKQNAERYLPFPEDLFDNIAEKIKQETKIGFWLNLDGVYEYIEHSPTQVLNVSDPRLIIEPLKKLKEGIEGRLSALNQQKQQEENLKRILYAYSNLKKHIDLYQRKNELIAFSINEHLVGISTEIFDKNLSLYAEREKVNEDFFLIEKDYKTFLNQNQILETNKQRIEKIESKFFPVTPVVNDELINHKIQDLRDQEEGTLGEAIKDDLFLKKFEKEVDDEVKLLSTKLDIVRSRGELQIEKKQYDDNFGLASEELGNLIELNKSLFNSVIQFADSEETIDNVSLNSLKSKAEKLKSAYDAYLKIVTQDTPYDETIAIGKLANHLLPTVFATTEIDEDLISDNVVERLNKLTQDIQEIGARKVEILGSIFNEVYRIYSSYLTKVSKIDDYLKKKNKVITGGNRASLTSKSSNQYPTTWLTQFRKQLNSQMSYTGLFSGLEEEIDINQMMVKAFRQFGGSAKAEPADLMNPKSYFDLEFDLKLDNDESNSGSNGQTYTANALLSLARLSLIEDKNRNGIKIMPIDEAEGLGSNYDMLHELAKKEKYQILTMAIETAGEITENDQYIYIMNENNLADMDTYVPPLGIFSDIVVEDIDDYINSMPDAE